jgi:hypothetical protein
MFHERLVVYSNVNFIRDAAPASDLTSVKHSGGPAVPNLDTELLLGG